MKVIPVKPTSTRSSPAVAVLFAMASFVLACGWLLGGIVAGVRG